MKESIKIPTYYKSTINMVEGAYPSGIPREDYYPLIKIMKDSGMSDRSVSEVFSILQGGEYIDYMYDVAHATPNKTINENAMLNIISKLKNFGFDEWYEED